MCLFPLFVSLHVITIHQLIVRRQHKHHVNQAIYIFRYTKIDILTIRLFISSNVLVMSSHFSLYTKIGFLKLYTTKATIDFQSSESTVQPSVKCRLTNRFLTPIFRKVVQGHCDRVKGSLTTTFQVKRFLPMSFFTVYMHVCYVLHRTVFGEVMAV